MRPHTQAHCCLRLFEFSGQHGACCFAIFACGLERRWEYSDNEASVSSLIGLSSGAATTRPNSRAGPVFLFFFSHLARNEGRSVFDLAASAEGAAPSWATSSSGSGHERDTPSPGGGGAGPSWAGGAGDMALLNEEMRRSVDQLTINRSADSLRRPDMGEVFRAEEESADELMSKDLGPDQIGAFVRIGDDQARVRALNFVVALLKQKIEERDEAFLSKCVLTMLRLSTESAFLSVRDAFSELVELVRKAELPSVRLPGPAAAVVTRWIRPERLPSVHTTTEELTKRLLRNIDVMEGRIPHVIVLLAMHPTFLEKWYRTMMHLMRGTGPLPFAWRRYISIVACARFQCMPMLKLQEMDFLSCGGDPSWLQGVASPSLPPKLYALMELNGLLAHQPWQITAAKMEALLSSSKESQWSVGELVHAIGIMVTFHAVCGIVWGLGVTPEIDITEAMTESVEPAAFSPEEQRVQAAGDTKNIIDMLKTGPATFSKQRQNWAASGEQTKNAVWASAEDGEETKLMRQQQSQAGASSHQQYCERYVGPFVLE
jgi:hypothetical protein